MADNMANSSLYLEALLKTGDSVIASSVTYSKIMEYANIIQNIPVYNLPQSFVKKFYVFMLYIY